MDFRIDDRRVSCCPNFTFHHKRWLSIHRRFRPISDATTTLHIGKFGYCWRNWTNENHRQLFAAHCTNGVRWKWTGGVRWFGILGTTNRSQYEKDGGKSVRTGDTDIAGRQHRLLENHFLRATFPLDASSLFDVCVNCHSVGETKNHPTHFFSGWWVPGPKPIIQDEATLKLNSKQTVNGNTRELHFTMAGKALDETYAMLKLRAVGNRSSLVSFRERTHFHWNSTEARRSIDRLGYHWHIVAGERFSRQGCVSDCVQSWIRHQFAEFYVKIQSMKQANKFYSSHSLVVNMLQFIDRLTTKCTPDRRWWM